MLGNRFRGPVSGPATNRCHAQSETPSGKIDRRPGLAPLTRQDCSALIRIAPHKLGDALVSPCPVHKCATAPTRAGFGRGIGPLAKLAGRLGVITDQPLSRCLFFFGCGNAFKPTNPLCAANELCSRKHVFAPEQAIARALSANDVCGQQCARSLQYQRERGAIKFKQGRGSHLRSGPCNEVWERFHTKITLRYVMRHPARRFALCQAS